MKYSIHRALSELKLLDSRINKAIKQGVFIGYKKNSSNSDYNTHLNEKDFMESAISSCDSIIDLIKRRNNIKMAIVESNAKTYVTIAGCEYTVASAIERKISISYEKELLDAMISQYNKAKNTVNNKNDYMEMSLNDQVSKMVGNENTSKVAKEVEGFSEMYRNQNGWTLIDPLNLRIMIEKLEKKITDFESEVDYVLSTSNAIVQIEVD